MAVVTVKAAVSVWVSSTLCLGFHLYLALIPC